MGGKGRVSDRAGFRELEVSGVGETGKRKISRKKAAAFTVVAISIGLLLLDVAIVLPYLLLQGFYFGSDEVVSVVVDAEQPNNLIPNDTYIWDYIPNSTYRHRDTTEGVEVGVRVNSIGFRDEEPADSAGADVRFVALGDSFTFGWLVEHDQRWDEVLAARIQEDGGPTAGSVNLARWMFTFDQHALVLQEHMPEKCSMVVHLVYPSHVQTINRHEDVIVDGTITRAVDPLLHVKRQRMFYGVEASAAISKRLYFPFSWCLIQHHRNVGKLDKHLESQGTPAAQLDEKLIYQKEGQKHFENGWALTELSIKQISRFTHQRGIPYLVVVIPRSLQLSAAEWGDQTPNQEMLTTSLPQDRIREICRRTGWARCLDLLPAMRKAGSRKLYWSVDPHWRPAAHRLAAEEILRYLRREGLLPSAPASAPNAGRYTLKLTPAGDPPPILADYPQFVEPVRETRSFRAEPLIQEPGADLEVLGWRYSYHARGIVLVPNSLRADRTAIIVVHPWGVDDAWGWATPAPAGVAFFCTPEKNAVYHAHLRQVVEPFLKARRGVVRQVVFSLPGQPDPLRRGLYRSTDGPPTNPDPDDARRRLQKRLGQFRYAGRPLPQSLALDPTVPRTRAYLDGFRALDERKFNPTGFQSLPIPIARDLTVADSDVVFYDGQGYAALRTYLKGRGIKHVLLAGYGTDGCVRVTTAGYLNLRKDFNLFLVGDASLAAFPANSSPKHATNVALSAAAQELLITQVSWIRTAAENSGGSSATRPSRR